MQDPVSFLLKLQLDLLKRWCDLTVSVLQLYTPGPAPVPVKATVQKPAPDQIALLNRPTSRSTF